MLRSLFLVALLAGLAGCVTQRDKVAVVRGALFAQAEGSALGQAVAAELGQVAIDIGADKSVDPATVTLSPEAAQENAQGIATDRENRQLVLDSGRSLLKDLFGSLPYGGAAAGVLAGLWAFWRKGQVQKVAGALSTVLTACKAGTYKPGDTSQALAEAGADPKLAESIRQEAKG